MSFKKIFIFLIFAAFIVGGVYLAMNFGTSACNHDWVEKRQDNALVSAADCTHAAVYYKCCAKCDVISETLTFEYSEPLGHTVVSEADPQHLKSEASCIDPAIYDSYCSVCNETLDSFEYGEPLGHNFSETKRIYVYTSLTCTTPEAYYLACERCSVKHEEDITFVVKAAPGHQWVQKAHKDYEFSKLTCETDEIYYKSCSECNIKHESETFTVKEALGHKYEERVDDAYILVQGNCETDTVYAKSCANPGCGKKHETETFEVEAPGHHDYREIVHEDFLVNPDSTCGTELEYYITCSVCKVHTENDETFTGAKLEHELTDVAEVAATKTTHGAESHKVCTRCEAYFNTEGNSIDAPDVIHNYEWCENDEHTAHYKACTVEGCDAPHTDEGAHTYEGTCGTVCGVCALERPSQHVDEDRDGDCEKCGGNVPADEIPKDEGNEDEENFSDWMPL